MPGWLGPLPSAAQAPAWTEVLTGSSIQASGTSFTQAVATDASGNVFVTGYFTGQVAFGNTLLSSVGGQDLFVAKYVPSSATWAWAQSGGGTSPDQGLGVAVSGTSVLAVGSVVPRASFDSLALHSPAGASTTVLARLVDASPTPLPVQLTAFTAQASGPAAVRLTWATAAERHCARFDIERSLASGPFVLIGTTPAAGTSPAAHTYAFTDEQVPALATVHYYRLRQVDEDGTATYSPVQAVQPTAAPSGRLSVSPNPATGRALLRGTAPGTPVYVYEVRGQLQQLMRADASGTAQLELTGLAPGLYVVRAGPQALRLAVE